MLRSSKFNNLFKFLAVFLALSPALVLGGCNETAAEKKADDRPVLVTTVRYQPEMAERSFVGSIRPRTETDMAFRVTGKVAKRLVEVGDQVKAGQPLAVLDEVDLKLQSEQAEAEHRAATGVLAQAEASERRVQELRGRGWATQAQMEQVRASADEARARVQRAVRSVELTRNSLSYATLVADGDGVVTATVIDPGQVVAAGQAAVRVARSSEKEVVVSIPETLLGRVNESEASVILWSDPGKKYPARLREIAPSADPVTRTYLAKFSLPEASLPEANEKVKLGMTATLTLSDSSSAKIARVPLSALFDQGKGASLFVVEQGSSLLRLMPVEVKAYEARDVLIAGGVEDGASVVVLGVQKLDPGQKVRTVSALSF